MADLKHHSRHHGRNDDNCVAARVLRSVVAAEIKPLASAKPEVAAVAPLAILDWLACDLNANRFAAVNKCRDRSRVKQ